MYCLGFDCSGKDVVAGLWYGADDYIEICLTNKSGTENLMQAIDMCLKKANIEIEDIKYVGVCVGPGSWTGSRVAVSTLNGLVSGMKNVPKLFTFDVFDLISYNEIGDITPHLLVVPAYGEYVYVKKQDTNNDFAPSFMSKSECLEKFNGYKNYGLEQVFDETIMVRARLKEVLKDKASSGCFIDIAEIEPMYLRLSQAELQFKQKGEGRVWYEGSRSNNWRCTIYCWNIYANIRCKRSWKNRKRHRKSKLRLLFVN